MAQTQVHPQQGPNPFQQMPLMGQQTPQQVAINGYLAIDPALMAQITSHVQRPPNNASPAQQLAAVQSLFNVLRHGGTLGLIWQDGTGREPRSPSDTLRARGGDCDEMSTLFYAAARQLGIDVTGFRLSTMTLVSGGARIEHAPLLLEIGGSRYIVDPVMPRIVPVGNFNDATLTGILGPYFHLSGQGPSAATTPVTIQDRNDFTSAADIASVELLQRAVRNSLLGTSAGTASARRDLERIATIGSITPFITSQRDIVAQNVFLAYFNGADNAFTGGARGAAVVQGYSDALAIIGLVPSIANANEARVYRIHGGLGLCFKSQGRSAEARAQFSAQIMMRPADPVGHRNLINLEHGLGNRPAAIAACDAALLSIPQGPDYNAIQAFRAQLVAKGTKKP